MEEYNESLIELCTDRIARRIINNHHNKNIEKIYELIELEYIKSKSRFWFPGDIVLLYPSIKEMRSKNHYDTIYGAHIGKNMLYINYHALLCNMTTKRKYVLRYSLRFETIDCLPMYISELEELERATNESIPIRLLR